MCREVSSWSPASFWSPACEAESRSPVWWSSSQDWVQDVIMKCLHPYIAPGRIAWPCGRCPSCRANRRRIWTHRIMLEAMQHNENSFVTLTYDPACEPGSLVPDHLKNWLKRVRRRFEDRAVRYYAVGEYGDRGGRPHYHAAMFGIQCALGPFVLQPGGGRSCRCRACSVVRDSWNFGPIKGHTMVGSLEERSAAYIAGYVLKKMNTTWDTTSSRLKPFCRMSLKPGIGVGAIPDVASVVMQYRLDQKVDVPIGLRHGRSVMPLGRYLRRKLRAQCGLPENCPDEVIEAYRQGLLPVFEYADVAGKGNPYLWKAQVQYAFSEVNEQVNRNIQQRGRRKQQL